MNPQVDLYLKDGCGRCKLYTTPQCKTITWQEELKALRKIVLACELTEELKWKQPCYTYNNANVLMIAAFKERCVINFFKGALLKDPKNILEFPGENSQSAKWIQFTAVNDILKLESTIKAYIKEAIELEKSGAKVELKKTADYEVPQELKTKFKENPAFEKAFNSLTPGRQRGYLLFFAAAKQPATRITRIEKYTPQIFEGKGMND